MNNGKVAVMNLVWDEDMAPVYFTVAGLDNMELLRVMQELEEEHADHDNDTYLPAREVPKLLVAKGYTVSFLSSVSYSDWDEVSFDNSIDDSGEERSIDTLYGEEEEDTSVAHEEISGYPLTTHQLVHLVVENDIAVEHTDDESILRIRMIMALRGAKVID